MRTWRILVLVCVSDVVNILFLYHLYVPKVRDDRTVL